jgi:hypothetical protein
MRFWIAAIFSVVLGSAAGTALAGPPIDWHTSFAWEPGASFSNAPAGTEYKQVGIISAFDSPFGDLNPATKEYTFYVHGLISLGTVPTGTPFTFYETQYSGGFIEIYCDSTPDASYDPNPTNAGVPADFTDGILILSGTFDYFFTQTNNFSSNQTGNLEGSITWTGGTRLEDTEVGGGQSCSGLFTGGITWKPSVLIAGYFLRHDGKIDLNCPVPTEPSTWGRIKSIYR